ncbi:MAG: uracil-xanthine permease [Clostridia bacterium]|nr:uracil-xanthine permease [Clostridia bacterium]
MGKDKNVVTDAVYDARALGGGKMAALGLQHMFAMFGATVLVPALTGLSVSVTLLFAGLGTLLFHWLSKWKVPAFLGSSFAFLGGYAAIAPMLEDGSANPLLPYACFGVACAGLVYLVLAALIKAFGVKKVMRFFPPIVTGPIIMAIGLNLSTTAISSCSVSWGVALVATAVVVVCNIWGKGMIKIIPILMGVVASYIVGALAGQVDFSAVREAAWIGLPVDWGKSVFGLFGGGEVDKTLLLTSVITIVPIALATMVEHIGDICAISSTCNKNFIEDPGLHRTLMGDGIATTVASLFGAPANTTYGENTGVLALTKVYDPRVVRIAAGFAILFSFSPKFAAIITAIPVATMGGVSLVLYGMIAAIGVRNIVENQVDFSKSRNVIIAALILVLATGINYGPGAISIGAVSLSGLAVASIVGIAVNAILPGKDYEFGKPEEGTTSVSFKV